MTDEFTESELRAALRLLAERGVRRFPEGEERIDVDAEPWTCSKCTYHHAEAEAGFLACAMCGAQKE